MTDKIFSGLSQVTKLSDIYYFKNTINDKYYIGQAVNIQKRLSIHKSNAHTDKQILYKAFKKYGIEKFEFGYIELCKETDKEKLDELEKKYIQQYNSYGTGGYNMTFGGDAGVLGYKHSNEMKKRISDKIRLLKNKKFDVSCYIHYTKSEKTYFLDSLNVLDSSEYDFIKCPKREILQLLNSNECVKHDNCIVDYTLDGLQNKIEQLKSSGKYYNSGMFVKGQISAAKGKKFPNRKRPSNYGYKLPEESRRKMSISRSKYDYIQYDENNNVVNIFDSIVTVGEYLGCDKKDFYKIFDNRKPSDHIYVFMGYYWSRKHK